MGHKREPTLDEILNEPIIRKVMKRDGYTPDDVRLLMRQASVKANGKGLRYLTSPTIARDAGPQHIPTPKTLNACCPLPA
ncbi:hypothetical protein AAAK29_29790 [Mesorhizobium sp. CCNWLW179-1]|uniref:hypothetical protein n=1 Tax=unclassified Mesorhizobium TaxID=325217 RepID=UPI003014808F